MESGKNKTTQKTFYSNSMGDSVFSGGIKAKVEVSI